MTPVTCADVRADAPELALDVLSGDRRAAVLAHLEGCAACRAEVDDLVRAADAVLCSLPAAPPPPGFANRVRAAMTGPTVDSPPEAPDRRPSTRRGSAHPPRRNRRLVAAAVTAAVVLTAVGGVIAGNATQNPSPTPSAADPGTTRVRALIGTSGPIGSVALSDDDPTWISMNVTGEDSHEAYSCEVILRDGSTHRVGTLTVRAGSGGWSATVPYAADQITAVRVVDSDGATTATAHFS